MCGGGVRGSYIQFYPYVSVSYDVSRFGHLALTLQACEMFKGVLILIGYHIAIQSHYSSILYIGFVSNGRENKRKLMQLKIPNIA